MLRCLGSASSSLSDPLPAAASTRPTGAYLECRPPPPPALRSSSPSLSLSVPLPRLHSPPAPLPRRRPCIPSASSSLSRSAAAPPRRQNAHLRPLELSLDADRPTPSAMSFVPSPPLAQSAVYRQTHSWSTTLTTKSCGMRGTGGRQSAGRPRQGREQGPHSHEDPFRDVAAAQV